ncbi:MAG: hypothetical protein LBD94_03200, partial [Rickettsiales bacterium]|nr:hypothetical protein [Rickettsiales bacterium]
KPFSGVANFYELANLLTFDSGTNIADQKLASIPTNKPFVQNFVSRNKKFAKLALDKCTEIADTVWQDYLDKAMLEIHYAQAAKVEEIKRGCFDFVRECYASGQKSVTDFMKNIMNVSGAALKPETIFLTSQLCEDYVESCDLMFGRDGIVSEYIKQVDNKDIITTCRNVAKECFDTYGGIKYNNFYNPNSGLFKRGEAMDWFSLYGDMSKNLQNVVSKCAKRLIEIEECIPDIEVIFGGVDKLTANDSGQVCYEYGLINDKTGNPGDCNSLTSFIFRTKMRETGIATEVYNNIIGSLSTTCSNYSGAFIEYRSIDGNAYCSRQSKNPECDNKTPCSSILAGSTVYKDYGIEISENMCPYQYDDSVIDTSSWGLCSCWANGGRRADNIYKTPGCHATVGADQRPGRVDGKGRVCPGEIIKWKNAAGIDEDRCACTGSESDCLDYPS